MPVKTETTKKLIAGISAYAGISTLLVILFAFLTAVGALVRIPLPFTPVPITLQVLFVLLAGAFLGGVRGSISQVLYVAWGALGLPLFAGAYGLAAIVGPTGGYLVGFIPAALMAGWLLKRAHTVFETWFCFFAASLIILACGFLHMTIFYTHNIHMSLVMGVWPFIIGDIIKVTLATAIYSQLKKYIPSK